MRQKHIRDLNPTLLREIDQFFVNYHEPYGKKFQSSRALRPQRGAGDGG